MGLTPLKVDILKEAVTHRTSRCLNLTTVHVVYSSFTLSFTHFYEKNRVPIYIRHSANGWGSRVKYDFVLSLKSLQYKAEVLRC